MDKWAKELCGFAKTKDLEPGESQTLHITFAIEDLASYDDTGIIAKSCYVLEKGTYTIYVGTDVRTATIIDYAYTVSEDTVTKQLTSYGSPEKLDKRMKADGTYETLECQPVKRAKFSNHYHCAEKPEENHPLLDVLKTAYENGELTREDLCVCVKRILEMILWLDERKAG